MTKSELIAIVISVVALGVSSLTAYKQLEIDSMSTEANLLTSQITACVELHAHHTRNKNYEPATQAINAMRSFTNCLSESDMKACRERVLAEKAGQMCVGEGSR